MRYLGQLMKINLKLSVKKVSKKGAKPNKCDHSVWDALPWDFQEKKMHDLPINPCVSHTWKDLFCRETRPHLRS
jgi:hypothetical protein